MSIKLKVKTNPSPCKHTVITAIEDEVDSIMVFHDSDFESDDFVPDADSKHIYKAIKKQLKKSGKKLSKSKLDIEELVI